MGHTKDTIIIYKGKEMLKNLIPKSRRMKFLDFLKQYSFIRVNAFIDMFDVAPVAIRRDSKY